MKNEPWIQIIIIILVTITMSTIFAFFDMRATKTKAVLQLIEQHNRVNDYRTAVQETLYTFEKHSEYDDAKEVLIYNLLDRGLLNINYPKENKDETNEKK